jgi:Bacterial protein of unknown function (HtrL_YibB)
MHSILRSRGSASRQTRPALQHDKKEKRFLAACFLFVLVLMRLHAVKEMVTLAKSKPGQNQPADFQHNNNDSSPFLTASTVLQMPLPSSSVMIHKLSPTSSLKSCPNTIVTGYFPLRSKHSGDNYLGWMKNMLSIQDCMVVMTSASMVETIASLRQHAMNGTVIIEMKVDDLPIAQLQHDTEQNNPLSEYSSSSPFWTNQLEMDREKRLHKSHQVFWIWLSKTWCVAQAIEQDYFHSSFYMWQDIGAFRNQEVRQDGGYSRMPCACCACVLRVCFCHGRAPCCN